MNSSRSEIGYIFETLKKQNQEKRAQNQEDSVSILLSHGVAFLALSPTHLRIGDFDFWPSTGLYMNRKTNLKSRGVFNLLRDLKKNSSFFDRPKTS